MKQLNIPIIVFIGIIAVGTITYFFSLNKTRPNEIPATPQATSSPLPTTSLPSPNPNNRQFVSQNLGIRFEYAKEAPTSPSYAIKTLEEGNKVFVYVDNRTDPHTGQWVEIFQKPKTQTLADAIKLKFLVNYSEKDCYVSTQTAYPNKIKLQPNYEIAEITFPKTTGSDAPWWENADKCPATYTSTNGISYFLMDTKHPDKFAYFSIGQYAIPAGTSNPQTLWQDTFRFTQ